ncbi:hypothetical protein [Aneurinibacillus sp. REN35]
MKKLWVDGDANHKKAFQWYMKAAKQGNKVAQERLKALQKKEIT